MSIGIPSCLESVQLPQLGPAWLVGSEESTSQLSLCGVEALTPVSEILPTLRLPAHLCCPLTVPPGKSPLGIFTNTPSCEEPGSDRPGLG